MARNEAESILHFLREGQSSGQVAGLIRSASRDLQQINAARITSRIQGMHEARHDNPTLLSLHGSLQESCLRSFAIEEVPHARVQPSDLDARTSTDGGSYATVQRATARSRHAGGQCPWRQLVVGEEAEH
jgi:hypothetical protein